MSTVDPTTSVSRLPIPGQPAYEADTEGTIWSRWNRVRDELGHVRWEMTDDWRPLTPRVGRRGYLTVRLYQGKGKSIIRQISNLVLETFVGPRPPGMEACHDPDPDKNNNRLCNLRWDTPKENAQDAVRWRAKHGIKKQMPSHRGSKNHFAELTEAKVLEIRRRLAEGEKGKDLAEEFHVSRPTISDIKHRRSWVHL